MKKTLALCALLLLPPMTSPAADGARLLDTWSEMNTWESGVQAAEFAQTLDKKFVFVAGREGGVQIYSAVGEHLTTVPTKAPLAAMDIDQRGRTLYVAEQNGICAVFRIDMASGFPSWSAQGRWKTRARPVDVASLPDRQLVFVLEADSVVRMYSYTGALLGFIPVPSGISAIDLVPRSAVLYLMGRHGRYTAVRLHL
uniref:YncE family protein n=1 Tax=Candidatus Electronema sp. TaxID=2698783 RepID=UPI0040572EBE